MRAGIRRGASWAAQLVLTLAATYFLFRSLDVSWAQLTALEPGRWRPDLLPLAASVALLVGAFVYMVALWARMVRALGGPGLRLGESCRIFFLANLGRYLPGKIWQLAGLVYLAGKRGVSLPIASSAAVLGQIFSLGAALVVGGLLLGLAGKGMGATTSGSTTVFAVLVIGLAAVTLLVAPPLLRWTLRVAFRLGGTRQELPSLDRWFGIRWLGLYAPGWVSYGVAFGLLWAAFPGLAPVAWPIAVGGFALAYFLGYAALFAPAGVGVREGALAVALAPALGATEATLLAVIARIWMTLAELAPLAVIALAGAAGFFAQRRRRRNGNAR